MLIVCPSCATSYAIDPAAVGPAGRTVRCARCKATWFTGGPKADADVTAFVDSVIAEAEAAPAGKAPPPPADRMPPAGIPASLGTEPSTDDDFGAEPAEAEAESGTSAPPITPPSHDQHLMPDGPAAETPIAIADAPSLVPPMEHVAQTDAADAELDAEDIESFAARRQRLQARRKEKRRSSRWTAIILLLLAFNVAVIGARNEVVHYFPQTASLFSVIGLTVNLRHLKFEGVKISKEVQGGVTMLVVHGVIVSTASKPTEVPRLRFAARNATGQELYTWTAQPSRSILEPGEKLEFSSQLASPPADANDVLVRFFTAQDAAAGLK